MFKHKHETQLRRVVECGDCGTLADTPYDEPRAKIEGFTYDRHSDLYTCEGCEEKIEAEIQVDFLSEEGGEVYASHPLKGTYWVGIYDTDRLFGGREEGGWWYNSGVLKHAIKKKFSSLEDAHRYRHALQQKLNPRFNNRGSFSDLGSVLCEGRMTAEVFKGYLPSMFPEQRPYYR